MAAATVTTACASCLIGPASTSLLSFTAHDIETITVSVIPHITVYSNGSRSTTYDSITLTQTEVVGEASGTPQTYTNLNDIIWTVDDAVLTYPTTYVQYLGFSGAVPETSEAETCAESSDIFDVLLPATTDPASFIYALSANATYATALPAPLLEYLDGLDDVSLQFHGQSLTSCAPLTQAPGGVLATTTAPIEHTTSSYSTSSVSNGAPNPVGISILGGLPPPVTHTSRPTTHPQLSQNITSSYSCTTTYSHTFCYASSPIVTSTTVGGVPPPDHSLSPQTGGQGPQPSTPAPLSESPTSTRTTAVVGTSTNSHTTAYIIHPITGRPIITTISPSQTLKPATVLPTPEPAPLVSSGGGSPSGGVSPPGSGAGGSGSGGSDSGGSGSGGTGSGGSGSGGNGSGGSGTGGSGAGGSPSGTGSTGGSASGLSGSGSGDGGSSGSDSGGNAGSNTSAKSSISVAVITTSGHTITAIQSSSAIVVQEGTSAQTIQVGSSAVFQGQTFQAVPTSGVVEVNGLLSPLRAVMSVPGVGEQQQAVITAGGHTFTAEASGSMLLLEDSTSTATIQDGSATIFEGQTVQIQPSGVAVVLDGQTLSLSAAAASTTADAFGAVLTANSQAWTAVAQSGYVLLEDAQTTVSVRDGSATTFAGLTASFATSGSAVVVNGKTVALTSRLVPTAHGEKGAPSASSVNAGVKASDGTSGNGQLHAIGYLGLVLLASFGFVIAL